MKITMREYHKRPSIHGPPVPGDAPVAVTLTYNASLFRKHLNLSSFVSLLSHHLSW